MPLSGHLVVTRFQCCSELTHAGRPYELTLLVSTVLVIIIIYYEIIHRVQETKMKNKQHKTASEAKALGTLQI